MPSRVCFLLVYKAGVIIVPNMGGLGGQSPPSAGWCVSSKDYLLTSLVTKSHLRDLFFSLSGRHIAYFSQMVGAVCVHIHMGVGGEVHMYILSAKASGQSQLSSWIALCLSSIIFFETMSLTEHGARLG